MQIPAQIYAFDAAERANRRSLSADATVRDSRRTPNDALVHNLSVTGCLVATDAELTLGGSLFVGIPGIGVMPAHVTRIDGRLYGCAFKTPISQTMVDAALNTSSVVKLTVVEADFTRVDSHQSSMPMPDRWARRTRLVVIVGISAALWAGLAMLV